MLLSSFVLIHIEKDVPTFISLRANLKAVSNLQKSIQAFTPSPRRTGMLQRPASLPEQYFRIDCSSPLEPVAIASPRCQWQRTSLLIRLNNFAADVYLRDIYIRIIGTTTLQTRYHILISVCSDDNQQRSSGSNQYAYCLEGESLWLCMKNLMLHLLTPLGKKYLSTEIVVARLGVCSCLIFCASKRCRLPFLFLRPSRDIYILETGSCFVHTNENVVGYMVSILILLHHILTQESAWPRPGRWGA
jgi:hypothetical protein